MTQGISCTGSKLLSRPFRYEELLLQGSACLNGDFRTCEKVAKVHDRRVQEMVQWPKSDSRSAGKGQLRLLSEGMAREHYVQGCHGRSCHLLPGRPGHQLTPIARMALLY